MARIPLGRDPQYVPAWARNPASLVEGRTGLEGVPAPTADLPPRNNLHSIAPRLPKGGPNIEFPWRLGSEHTREFVVQDLLGDLPEPPNRKRSKLWLFGSLTCIVVAGVAAYGATPINWQDQTSVVPAAGASPNERVAPAPPGNIQSKEIEATPRLIVQDRRAYINEPLLLGLSLAGATGREYVILKGVGEQMRFSAGQPMEPNSWRLTAFDLGNVFAYSPKDHVGVTSVVVDLHAADDRRLSSQVFRLEWIPLTLASRGDLIAQPDQPVPQSPEIQLKLEPEELGKLVRRGEEIAMLVRRGQDMLKLGDISAARLVLRRAAEAGSSQAALMLGSTFDPLTLREFGVVGFASDLDQAVSWYEKALALGSGEAQQRIDRLKRR